MARMKSASASSLNRTSMLPCIFALAARYAFVPARDDRHVHDREEARERFSHLGRQRALAFGRRPLEVEDNQPLHAVCPAGSR